MGRLSFLIFFFKKTTSSQTRLKARGFTLIEVLISISLLSLLMLSAVIAYDFMQQNWQRNKANYQRSIQHHAQWQLLYDVLINTYPKLLFQYPLDRQQRDGGAVGFYFLGRENGFTAVSAVSFQSPESAAVYRLFKEPDPHSPGQWQLVYEEALLSSQVLAYAEQELPFAFRRILLTGQSQLSFSYQGWDTLQQRVLAGDPETGQFQPSPWHNVYDGMLTKQQPESWLIIGDVWRWQQPVMQSGLALMAQLDDNI